MSTTTITTIPSSNIPTEKKIFLAVSGPLTPTSRPYKNDSLFDSLNTLLQTRHSVRAFLPTPVPSKLIHRALSTSQLAPSNSNIQNWRLYLATGPKLVQLKERLLAAAQEASPAIPPLPAKYAHFRRELGAKVYGEGYGIPRSDVPAKIAKERRNYTFFDAPLAGIVCMDRELAKHDAMSVGMWLQSLLLGLTSQGLGSCVQVSTAGYADIVKEVLGIPDGLDVLCGVSIGYEDLAEKVNGVRSGRSDWTECVVEVSGEESVEAEEHIEE